MPDPYDIDITVEAKADLDFYSAATRKTIASEIQVHLAREPVRETRNRKRLNEHPIASWELRCEKFRVFYEVDEEERKVTVVSVGHKDRNQLFVREKEVKV